MSLKRPRTLINLDPANDDLPYDCDIDVRELVNVEDVMTELDLGPNGALCYAMEYIEVNLDWLVTKIRQATKDVAMPYLFIAARYELAPEPNPQPLPPAGRVEPAEPLLPPELLEVQ
ncbi:unnamed protein product [Effrenium voratum]|nr:unnamed protein product [Effrenium voratum]